MKIKDLFDRKIDRKIEEVIKVTQIDEQTVHEEIQEYVVTGAIQRHFEHILKSIIDAKSSPHEGIGVWVSGFFGSGKSSFAKILGYILEGKTVLGKSTRDLFNQQANSKQIADYLNYIETAIPMKSIIFDISMDRGVRSSWDKITQIMYKVFLREIDYAEDFDLAKLEIDLEEQGKLDKFIETYEREYSIPWRKGRKRASGINEASRILHLMEPKTYNLPDSWARTVTHSSDTGNIEGRADINPNQFARLVFELMDRRKKNTAAVFVVDEVGQYVSRSVDKMLDLQAIVQALGVEGKNRVKAKKAPAPVWLVVTSQEKLNEVVSSIGDKRIELARLRDRFPNEVDIAPTDIAEVTSKRVLVKKAGVVSDLKNLYEKHKDRINECSRLDHTSRSSRVTTDDFVNLYPYLPHFIDLSIDIMSGIRLEPGAQKFSGGSNRTIIKQAQQMLINPKTCLGDEEVGTLVTMDKIFDLIEGNLSAEKKRDIDEIEKRFPDNPWTVKVAKTICLLEYVRDLPRTPDNIAAVLYPNIDSNSVLSQVKEAIEILVKSQFIKHTDDGYKLLTAQEKNWDIKRNDLSPKPADRNRIRREIIKDILTDSKITHYKYNNLKTFKIAFTLDEQTIGADGDISISMHSAEDASDLASLSEEKKRESREERNKNIIYGVFAFNENIHNITEEVFKSERMIEDHKRVAAEGGLPREEQQCFHDEKIRRDKLQRQLRNALESIVYSGSLLFRGVQKDISSSGKSLSEGINNLVDGWFLDLYPKFLMGARQVSGTEAEEVLKAENLSGLPSVFYDTENGLNLVTREGDKYVINTKADIAQEVMAYINEKHAYGEKISGKLLDEHFSGDEYGWQRDLLRLVLGTLFRAGLIEISYQGKRYRDYTEHQAREPITKTNPFRNAAFYPREQTITMQQIRDACLNYEAITGKEVDAEESAIAKALKELVGQNIEDVMDLHAQSNAYQLPVKDFLAELLQTFRQIAENSSDDCVKFIAEEGKELKNNLEKIGQLKKVVNDSTLKLINESRQIHSDVTPIFKSMLDPTDPVFEELQTLNDNIRSEDFYQRITTTRKLKNTIYEKYVTHYDSVHKDRHEAYNALQERIISDPDWESIQDDMKEILLRSVNDKLCEKMNLDGTLVCQNCRASYTQLESDISAVVGIEQNIRKRIREYIQKSDEKIEYVRISEYFDKSISSIDEFKEQLDRFMKHIDELLKEGKKVILE